MRWRRMFAMGVAGLAGCAASWPVFAQPGAAPALVREVVTEGGARKRVVRDDAPLVLWFAAEHQGSMDTCGCPHRPRGSLARLATYVDAARRTSPDSLGLLLHAGWFASTTLGPDLTLRADARVQNAAMVDGLAAAGFDVLNVSLHDLPWLGAQPSWPVGAVSANITAPDGRAPPTHRLFTRAGLRVAVTGVTAPGLDVMQPDGFGFRPPVEALDALLPTLRAEADVVVVLALGLGADAKQIAALPGVDVLIEADGFGPRMEAFHRGEVLWARANAQTETLGELRLDVADGRVTRALDRAIDLDPSLASRADLARATRRTRKQAAAALAEVLAGEAAAAP